VVDADLSLARRRSMASRVRTGSFRRVTLSCRCLRQYCRTTMSAWISCSLSVSMNMNVPAVWKE
jgi:hypothetical protein